MKFETICARCLVALGLSGDVKDKYIVDACSACGDQNKSTNEIIMHEVNADDLAKAIQISKMQSNYVIDLMNLLRDEISFVSPYDKRNLEEELVKTLEKLGIETPLPNIHKELLPGFAVSRVGDQYTLHFTVGNKDTAKINTEWFDSVEGSRIVNKWINGQLDK